MVIALAGLCVLLLVVFAVRLRSALDEGELALRSMVSSLRALGRAARHVAPVAERIVDDVAAGEVALGRLEAMKSGSPGRPGGQAAQ